MENPIKAHDGNNNVRKPFIVKNPVNTNAYVIPKYTT